MNISSPPRFLMFAINEMAEELGMAGKDVIRLTLGKSDLPLRSEITEAMVEAIRDPEKANLVYPAGLPQLREALARFWSSRHCAEVTPDRVLISTGTSTLFRNLFACLTEPGDEVVLPLPYYPLYVVAASLAHLVIKFYELDPKTGGISYESLAAAITPRTKAVVVNSPGNPLGNCLDRESIAKIDDIVGSRAVIISDEIYADQTFDGPAVSALDMSTMRSPLVVTSAFSKGFRMYARRIGYCIAPPNLIRAIAAVQDHTLLTTDPVPQFGAIEALKYPAECDHLREVHRARRDATVAALQGNNLVDPIVPRGGFYFTVDCRKYMAEHHVPDSFELAKRLLLVTGVATVPGLDFGIPSTLRLSFTSSRYVDAVKRLADFFETSR